MRRIFPKLCACGETAFMRGSPTVTILVDAAEISVLEERGWYANPKGYIQDQAGNKLHRRILDAAPRDIVDHRKHNRADCRRGEMRICDDSQSLRNRRPQKGARSRFKGVCWYGAQGKWTARIVADGKREFLGCFDDEEAAAAAYDLAAVRLHGAFAYSNLKRSA